MSIFMKLVIQVICTNTHKLEKEKNIVRSFSDFACVLEIQLHKQCENFLYFFPYPSFIAVLIECGDVEKFILQGKNFVR